jgi:acyl-CoA synthetase (AMP-forming)/AMP-acid ligase II
VSVSFSLATLLAAPLRQHPEKVAITDGSDDISFRELDRRAGQVARALTGLEVQPGERVVFVGRNSAEFFESLIGTARVGAVLAPLNWRLTASEIAGLVADARARVVIADSEFVDLVPVVEHRIFGRDAFGAWRESASSPLPDCAPSPDDVVVQSYTSGTTGLPKGVLVTNRMYESAARLAGVYGVTVDSVVGLPMPVFHVGGSVGGVIALAQGASVVSPRVFEPASMLDLIEKYGITWMPLAPTLAAMIGREQVSRPRNIASWTAATYGGQPITRAMQDEITSALNIRLFQAYGLTETAGSVTCLRPEDHRDELLLSAGRPVEWVELGAFDIATGARLGANQIGEIMIQSDQNTPGYWQKPDATAALFSSDGWIRTGDVGFVDERGFLFLADRLNDMIISGGENVHPIDIERALEQHPGIREAAVVGEPHDTWGESVVAFIVVNDGSILAETDVIDWTRTRLAGFQRPRRVVIVDQLPKSSEGKLIRHQLKSVLWAGQERAIG